MTEGLAIEIAGQMMKEQGIGNRYLLRYRHLQISPLQIFVQMIEHEVWILLTQEKSVKILSRTGIFDMSDAGINEMQHVQGFYQLPIPVRATQFM